MRTREIDQQIISRYTDQPAELPAALRARVEAVCGGPVMLYAYADLDEGLRLTGTWVVLGASSLAMVPEDGGEIRVIARDRIHAIDRASGLSATTLTFVGAAGADRPVVVRYTNRQKGAFESLCFVLEEALEGRRVETQDADRSYTEATARPVRGTQGLIVRRRGGALFRLLGYLRPYRRELLLGMSAAVVITLVSMVPPYIAGRLIDGVIRPATEGRLGLERAGVIAWIAIATLALVHLIRQVAAMVRLRLMAVVGELVARDLRDELYERIQRLSLSFFSRKKTGSLITRVSSDTDRLWEFLAFGVVDVSLSLVMLIGLGAVLISLDWRLGLAMTLPAPVFCWLIFRHGREIEPLFLRAWRKWSAVTDLLSDTITGIRVVKAFDQEGREIERFAARNFAVTHEANRVHRMWSTFWPLLTLGIYASTVLVWVLAVPRLLGSGAELSTGTFVAFLLYATMFTSPIETIGQMARTMNRATSSAHRVFEVLDTESEVRDSPAPVRLEPMQGRVTFDNVSFGYDGVRTVLSNISFDVAPGELVGLVGPSGGGKTTLVNLIARFYDVSGGEVRVDGIDVRRLDSGHYRRQIGMVLQDPHLFHATVLENIRYGKPDASLGDVVAAAKAANVHDFVCKLPHGYETAVGERGHTLSGGERQRVSIARAILHDPRILILDEATSAVDTETEREIQEALERLIVGRTVFAIAHRLSTLRRATRLFVIVDGRLMEQGTHDELLQRPAGRYRRLHELQLEMQ